MNSIATVVSNLLMKREDFCILCFKGIGPNAIKIQDEVITDKAKPQNTIEMSEILNDLLGNRLTSDLSAECNVCGTCTEIAKTSYKFIKSCQENCENLLSTLDTLNDCVENTTDDLKSYNTLFIAVDTSSFLSKQFYDTKKTLSSKSSVLTRLKTLSRDTKSSRTKTPQKSPKKNNDLLEICDVIKDENARKSYKCKKCSRIINKLFNFKKHYYSQHSPKVFKCNDCDKSYGSEALLKQHRYDCHMEMSCSECGKVYNNRYSLLYHLRGHTGEQPYDCKYCDLKFHWASRRAEHVRRCHMEPGVECDICHIKFKALGSLYDHRKRHFNPHSRLHVKTQAEEVIEEGIVDDILGTDCLVLQQ